MNIKKIMHIDKHMIPSKIASLLNGIHLASYAAFLNIFFVSVGLSKFHAGIISGVMYLPPILAAPFWGYIVNKSGKPGLILAILCIGACCFIVPLPWISQNMSPIISHNCNPGTQDSNNSSIANITDIMKTAKHVCSATDEDRELVLFGVLLTLTTVGAIFLVPIISYIPALVMTVVQSMTGNVSYGNQTIFFSFGSALGHLIAGQSINHFESSSMSPYTPVFFIFLSSTILLIPVGLFLIHQAKNGAQENGNGESGLRKKGYVDPWFNTIPSWAMTQDTKEEFNITSAQDKAGTQDRTVAQDRTGAQDRKAGQFGQNWTDKDEDQLGVRNADDVIRNDGVDSQFKNEVMRRGKVSTVVKETETTDDGMTPQRGMTPHRGIIKNQYSIDKDEVLRREEIIIREPTKAQIKNIKARRCSIAITNKNLNKMQNTRRRSIWSKRIDLKDITQPQNLWQELFRFLQSFDIIFFILSVLVVGIGNSLHLNFIYMLISDAMKNNMADMTWVLVVMTTAGGIFFPFTDRIIGLVQGPIPALIIGMIANFIRLLVLSLEVPFYVVIVIQVLEALAFTLAFTAILEHTRQITPDNLQPSIDAIVQTVYRCVSSFLVGVIGGRMFEIYGGKHLFRATSYLCAGWSVIMIIYYGGKKCRQMIR